MGMAKQTNKKKIWRRDCWYVDLSTVLMQEMKSQRSRHK